MAYIAYMTIEYDCHNQYYDHFKKIHERMCGDHTIADTPEESMAAERESLVEMRAAYERSGWHTEDYLDGFVGERNGNKNYHYGLTARQLDTVPVRTVRSPSKRTASTPAELTDKEKAFLADLAKLCEKFGLMAESNS